MTDALKCTAHVFRSLGTHTAGLGSHNPADVRSHGPEFACWVVQAREVHHRRQACSGERHPEAGGEPTAKPIPGMTCVWQSKLKVDIAKYENV